MSLANTRIKNLVVDSNLDMNELRPSQYGVLDFFMKSSKMKGGIISEDLKKKAKASIGNTIEIPVINYDGGISIGNTRSVTIADSENTSALHTLTFATYSWGFTIVPSAFMNNEVSIQEDFQTKFDKYLFKFGATLDAGCAAALEAAKTQVFGKLLRYTQTGNAVQVPWAKRKTFLGDMEPMLNANDHYGRIHVVGDTGIQSLVGELAEGGLYNAENKQLQYNGKTLHWSNRVTAAEYGSAYAVLPGKVGILTRFEREALLNTQMQDGTAWGISKLPMLDFPIGTYYYESKGDFSSVHEDNTEDNTRARKEHYGFAVDVCYVTPYNSDPANIAMPIMKFDLLDEV